MTHDPYAFISPSAIVADDRHRPLLRSPMEHAHVAAGAILEEHDGWQVAIYDAEPGDAWLADVSHLGKLDLRGTAEELDGLTGHLQPGHLRVDGDVWTLRLTAIHGYVLCPFDHVAALRDRIGPNAIDVTCGLAAVDLGGPGWRKVWARSSGLDVREHNFPPGRCMAGSVMRVPTLCAHGDESVLMLVGWEYGEYFWEAILDAGETLGIVAVTRAVGAREEVEA
jgi:glycine cleavage system aminomethyltransferase T